MHIFREVLDPDIEMMIIFREGLARQTTSTPEGKATKKQNE
jgi:hypothetical protein